MLIDVVSDTVCPWCYVGKRNLDAAIALRPGLDITVRWHPYQLSPDTPVEGVDRKAYMAEKFGDRAKDPNFSAPIKAAGAASGISFAFDAIKTMPNTFDSHRLIMWAGGQSPDIQSRVVEEIFKAYFTEGRNIGDKAVLTEIAGQCGMDAAVVADLLSGEADRKRVAQAIAYAYKVGISGVPTFVFDGKAAISGAHEPARIVEIIDKVPALAAPSAAAGV